MILIGGYSRDDTISGVLLGACYVGQSSTALEVCLEDSAIRWWPVMPRVPGGSKAP